MKNLRLAFISLAVVALLPAFTSCKSDDNPFNLNVTTSKNTATIQLRLSVEDTRAGELSTAEENNIKNVTVHVFNEKQNLEVTKNAIVSNGSNTVDLEVSQGLKTIYVITAKSNVNPAMGTSLSEYENKTFISSLENIKTSDGFVMVGKSAEQQVMVTASNDNLPVSNVFNIKLVRLVAKAQVKSVDVDGSSFGITFGAASFKAFQLNQRMRVLHNGSDVLDSYVDSNNNGTYDNYTLGVGDYLNAVTSGDFSAEGCAYLSENIVSRPLSGNTTFLSVRYATTPKKYYTFDAATSSVTISPDTPAASDTYYAVGIQDKSSGFVDYALYTGTKNIITFKNQEDAVSYMNSLNKGESSAITVSQTDKPLLAPAVSAEASTAPQFEVINFDNGYAYYRVNIAHQETSGDSEVNKFKVMRNKYYKVIINSVKSLGFSSELLLRPSNPAADVDAEGHSWISATISIADWEEVIQKVDL